MKAFFSVFSLAIVTFVIQSAQAAPNCTAPSPRSSAFLENTPCAPISTACNTAGYFLGCHKVNNKGLEPDCIIPIAVKGATVAGVNPAASDVAACKTYCQANKGACRPAKDVADR